MSSATEAMLRAAVADPVVVARYRSHILVRGEHECWPWTGAIAGNGHGRFQVGDAYLLGPEGDRQRVTYVVIAHRVGYAVLNGVDALLQVPLLAHECDNPLCQQPRCWRESSFADNRREFVSRRRIVLSPLADVRGARGRARAVRDAARAGGDVEAAGLDGALPMHRDQLSMFEQSARSLGRDASGRAQRSRWVGDPVRGGGDGNRPGGGAEQGTLFGDGDGPRC